MFSGGTNSSEDIIKRLEKLNQWQDKQKQILLDKQSAKRILLSQEQQDIYNQFGFSKDSPKFTNSTVSEINRKGSNDNVQKANEESFINITKRPFLKRGQGLKSRFKIDPDSLKLHNLPKYKYANSHKKYKTLSKRNTKNNKQKDNECNSKENFNGDSDNSKKNQIKVKGNYLEYETDKLLCTGSLKLKKSLPIECKSKIIHQETEFALPNLPSNNSEKNSLIEKNLTNDTTNSTLNQLSESTSTKTPPFSWAQILDPANIEPIVVSRLRRNSNSSLSDNNKDDTENLSLFELLEKKAEEGSFCFDSSTIKQWIQNKLKSIDSTDDSQILISNISEELKRVRIHPLPCDIDEKDLLRNSDDDGNDIDDNDDEDDNDDDNDYDDDHEYDDDEDDHDKLSDSERQNHKHDKGHVRFSDDVQINEVKQIESDCETVTSNEMNTDISSTMTSTPLDKEQFEKFKKQLFTNNSLAMSSAEDLTLINDNDTDNNNQQNNNDQSQIDDIKKEIIEKSEVLKLKLKELEQEIETFQKHNTELIKMKQEHELEKIKLQQERIEIEEKLNDEKIKLEIYLHDERLKIEDERKKLEKQKKLNKAPNRKEREEIIKLKEEIENLQTELKNKEGKHVSAQARLRAQIRNLEKDLKDLSFELDHLKKENKRLERDNIRLNRQQGNKVLQEINKTIAKLAAPQTKNIPTTEVNNKNPKAAVAKVVSHKNSKTTKWHRKSRSIPDFYRHDKDENNESSSSTSSSSSESEEDLPSNNSNAYKSNTETRLTVTDKKESQNDSKQLKTSSSSSKISTDCFKREIINSDGSKDIWYPNGNLKKISQDGMIIRMLYFNKDIKETNINEGTIKYYYSETNTWHTQYLDGLEILEFPNGQIEHRYKDGKIEIHFPNGSIKITNPNDNVKLEEWRYNDGTSLINMKNGDKMLLLPNGQKEIHTKIHKRREYPDGTVKIVYPDGSQETRYSNGRVRLKDKDGNLIMDSENMK